MSSDNITKTMKVDTITGESQLQGATGEIDLFAFDFSAHKPTDHRGPGLAESGAPYVTPVSVSFVVCGATPPLKQNFFKGTTFKTVVLKEYKTDQNNSPKPFRTVTLTDAQIQSIQNNDMTGSLTFVFKKLEEEFFTQDTVSNVLKSAGKVSFDMLTKTAA
ncbi:Hcp1 family type VI secretion system effector [Burkholderia sp. 4701]|nr:Hcp1 family type VI secretion system effector [Burkholderia sp. 4701]MXN81048.1 Hcp1 family type VI secretion system effector [Burkholderia sp. 4812]